MKKIIIIIGIIIVGMSASQAQVSFEYDNAGNRTIRTMAKLSFASPEADSSNLHSQELIYKDLFEDLEVQVFPNPTKGILKVSVLGLKENQEYSLRILSMNGRRLESQENMKKPVYTFNITALQAGNYLLEINIDKVSKYWKIIKE